MSLNLIKLLPWTVGPAPKVGDRWQDRDQKYGPNPFSDEGLVRVLEIREGWVKIEWDCNQMDGNGLLSILTNAGNMTARQHTHSREVPIKWFKREYKFARKATLTPLQMGDGNVLPMEKRK